MNTNSLLSQRPRLKLTGLLMLLISLLGVGGCSWSDHMNTFDTNGPVAQEQLVVFYYTFWVSVFIFVVVGSLMIFAVFRFRHSEPETLGVHSRERHEVPLPPQTHGNTMLEVCLTAASVFLLCIIAVPTMKGIFLTAEPPDKDHAYVITAKGYQWWWAFEYPNGAVTANEMRIPIGKPIVVKLKAMDVIHSFWVPKLAGKVDLIPNQHNELWLQADQPGRYYGQCAEFCGDSHANMRFKVITMYDAEFNAWVAQQKMPAQAPVDTLAIHGMDIFVKGPADGHGQACATCHTVQGTPAMGVVGPNLTHVASRSTIAAGMMEFSRDNVADWLTHLATVKPGNKMLAANLKLSPEEVTALTAYISTLK